MRLYALKQVQPGSRSTLIGLVFTPDRVIAKLIPRDGDLAREGIRRSRRTFARHQSNSKHDRSIRHAQRQDQDYD